jgi:hypothetical protein
MLRQPRETGLLSRQREGKLQRKTNPRSRKNSIRPVGGTGLEPAARKHVVPTYLPLDHLPPTTMVAQKDFREQIRQLHRPHVRSDSLLE